MIVEEAKRISTGCNMCRGLWPDVYIRIRAMAINRFEERLGLRLPMFLRFLNLPKYADLD
jgi:hypothetical protein